MQVCNHSSNLASLILKVVTRTTRSRKLRNVETLGRPPSMCLKSQPSRKQDPALNFPAPSFKHSGNIRNVEKSELSSKDTTALLLLLQLLLLLLLLLRPSRTFGCCCLYFPEYVHTLSLKGVPHRRPQEARQCRIHCPEQLGIYGCNHMQAISEIGLYHPRDWIAKLCFFFTQA